MGWTFYRAALRGTVGCALLVGGAGVGFGDIVITEILDDPGNAFGGNPDGEWFEIHNNGTDDVDIEGWTFSEDDGNNESFTISGSHIVEAGGYFVLGRNATKADNGGVTLDYEYGSGFILSNSADEIVITNKESIEQDRVDYTGSWPGGDATAMAFDTTTSDNNVSSNWSDATVFYLDGSTGNKGTPGCANTVTTCPQPDVMEPPQETKTGEIYELQGTELDSPYIGYLVTTNNNIVTAVGGGGFFIQTPTSRSDNDVNTSDGVFVVHSGSPMVMVGDQVDVVGTLLDGRGESDELRT